MLPAAHPIPLMQFFRLPASLLAVILYLLPACTQQGAAPDPKETPQSRMAVSGGGEIAARPFPIDTFYTLLVAEVAGNREHYDVALLNYYRQAAQTRDPGVAARATRIARFLNARRMALRSAQLWAELEPENAEAQLAATAELTLAGELDTALTHAEKALALGGDAPLQSLAATAVNNRTIAEKLLPEFRRMAQQYPDNNEAALAHAMMLRATEQYPQALAIVRQVQEQDPDLLDALLLETHLLVDQGERTEAVQLLKKLVSIYPRESRLRLQYARLLIREDLSLAKEQFAELVKLHPNDGNMILSLALIRYETGDLDAAKPLFERLLVLRQHESAAHFYLGSIAEDKNDASTAITHYRQVQPGNDYVEAISRGTRLLASAGELQHNRDWFTELRRRHPDQSEHFYLMEVQLLSKHEEYQQALKLADRALEKHSDSGRLLYVQALLNEQLGNVTAFERGMRQLLERDPDNATVLNALGYKLSEDEDRLDEALALISKALELRPDDASIIDSMGWIQYRLGNHSEAVKYLQDAMEKMPNHEIAAHLGEVLWVQGNRERAMEIWQQGLQINPQSKIIPAAMKRLQINESLEQHASES
ncbi:tetratricopeptide repeat protein [Microbulbifer thermotolerans]|uniref:tetratricopeptide repeat protein n=1 Tax=Microbulbifer thermotolerans TaxID=252514 RepID=UPI00224911F1|nr:tetratricopeptide repeat protein [Microbulbifer thermotolerans]MCX2780569.1 tetratricopeptide repeat protein [Microbulbifer thermotolerans]MCX2803501.1 tetratricopeptide repeat protein [Microbulbifer thermotolerans]MCX2830025.1 tetratricopeptide repeat protein [Microbulbifer thermotolerans]MCX2841494.1 tetratricopeptide repeat protein [Microbulbifer thermotolerans]